MRLIELFEDEMKILNPDQARGLISDIFSDRARMTGFVPSGGSNPRYRANIELDGNQYKVDVRMSKTSSGITTRDALRDIEDYDFRMMFSRPSVQSKFRVSNASSSGDTQKFIGLYQDQMTQLPIEISIKTTRSKTGNTLKQKIRKAGVDVVKKAATGAASALKQTYDQLKNFK